MAHLSGFSQRRQAETERLLSELVCATLCSKPGDAIYEAGLEWSLASVGWHQYSDVNPSSIDGHYEGLGARFGTHAQFSKQTMLGQLMEALHRQKLQEGTLEVHHGILSAILHLAGKPLQHDYQPSAAALACLQGVSADVCLDDTRSEGSALSHWDDLDCEAASSDLSDWAGSIAEPDTPGAGPLEDMKPDRFADAAPGKHSVMAKLLQLGQLDIAPKPEKLPVNCIEVPNVQDGHLLKRVLEVRAQGDGQLLPPAELGFTEGHLVHQILHMLRGCPSPGKAFSLNRASDAFTIIPDVHIARLSPACLSRVLVHWVRWGTAAYRLRAFSEGMGKAATAAGEARGKTPLVASTTLAAYATAFAAELDLVERKVVWLQDTFAAQSCANTGEASDVSLAALDYASQGIVRRIRMLEIVAGSISFSGPRLRTAAQQGIAAIDGLHRLLLPATQDSTPQGREYAAVLMRLLLAALKPSAEKLQLWIDEGSLNDHFDEMPICKGDRITTRSSDFWQTAFQLRTDDRGGWLCPELLRPVAEDILEAGKASLLLRTEQRCRGDSAAHSAALRHEASLHAGMLRRLEHQVQYGNRETSAPLQTTIADRMAASAAGLPDQRLSTHSLAGPSVAYVSSNSNCDTISSLAGSLPQADSWLADSLGAASLQEPASSAWQLTRHLSTGGAEAETEASDALTRHSEPPSSDTAQQQSLSDPQPLSPQQENQSAGTPCWHSEHGQHRHTVSAQRQSAGILGDVSNVISVSEQGAKSRPKQSAPACLQVAATVIESSQVGDTEAPSCCPPDTKAASKAANSRADNTKQQLDLGQADDLLRDWYSRTLEGICSASSLEAAASEPEGMRCQNAANHRLHSVLVAASTGAAVQQMWGAQWRGYAAEAAGGVSSLDALADADLSPVQALLESCILVPLLERADRSRQALMEHLTGAWALQQHLEALWRTLLLASPALQPFLSTVHDMLASSDRDNTELRAIDLQRALDMALSDAEHGDLLPCSSLRVHLEESASESTGVRVFDRLRLDISVPWPLTLFVQDTHLQQYNAIFGVLLQVHVAIKALNEVHSSVYCDSSRRGRGLDRTSALAMSMRHFLGAYLANIMGHLVHTSAFALRQAIAGASSLEDIVAAHELFLRDASGISFTAPQQMSKLLHHALCRLLSMVWEFAMIASSPKTQKAVEADTNAHSGELSSLWEAWQDRRRYFERLLKGCAVRASPSSGLKELAASVSLTDAAVGF